jgi:anaphase-promoting complex subunit 10
VKIVRLRIYLDFGLDESYTPTNMVFAAGTGEHDLVQFAEWKGAEPRGWMDIGLENCEPEVGGDGSGVLRCMCLQVRVLENHQNGKDTHIRGVQIFARDEKVRGKEKGKERERAREGKKKGGGPVLTVEEWEAKMERMGIEEFGEELEVR